MSGNTYRSITRRWARHWLLLIFFCFHALISGAQDISTTEFDSIAASLRSRPSDTSHINALVLMADYLIKKHGEDSADLNGAARYLSQAKQLSSAIGDSSRIDYITLIESYLWKERGRTDKSKMLSVEALRLVKARKDEFLLGKAYFCLSEYYSPDRVNELAMRILLMDSAADAYRVTGQIERQAFCLRNLAEFHLITGDIPTCLAECDSCLRIYNVLRFGYQSPIYDILNSAYFKLGDYKKALENGLHALEISRELNDSSLQVCEIEFNVAAIFNRIRDTAAAVTHLTRSFQLALLAHDKSNSFEVASELVHIYASWQMPKMGLRIIDTLRKTFRGPDNFGEGFRLARSYIDTYTSLGQFDQATAYIVEILGLTKTPNLPPEAFCDMSLVVIRADLAAGKYKDATEALTSYRQVATTCKEAKYRQWIFFFAFQLDTAHRQFSSAIVNLNEYYRIRDSISNGDQANEVQQLNIVYETSEREKHIQSLQNDQKLEQRALAQSNQSRNFALSGVALSLITISIGYSRYRLKQEKNRQLENTKRALEVKQEEVSRQNSELSHLLSENQWLLREVHHRVKNNLQIVKSLLDYQSAFLKDEVAQKAIRESQHRVQAMSLIHQKLYGSVSVSSIYIPEYINELIDYLKVSFDTRQRIYFRREIEDLHLDVSCAVPVGLILNEIITNAIKYAFPGNNDPNILIRYFRSGSDEDTLIVSDNGMGLPAGFDISKTSSFGFRLITGLAEDLGGKLEINRGHGTTVSLTFKVQARAKSGLG